MFERDTPQNWDACTCHWLHAWLDFAELMECIPSGDTEIHHLETSKPLEFSNLKVHESGPLRASLVADIAYGQSKIWVEVRRDSAKRTVRFGSNGLSLT